MFKKCEYCDTPFNPKTERSRFCRHSCAVGFSKRKKRDALLQILTCPVCQQNFRQNRSNQKYCSYECGKKQWDITKAVEARANTHTILTCQHCHGEFVPERFYSCDRQRFCSKECNVNFHKEQRLVELKAIRDANPIPPRDCEYCRTIFVPSNYGNKEQRFCCKKCKAEDYKARMRLEAAQVRANTVRICPICNAQFNPKKTLKEIYCSKYCARLIGRKIYKMMDTCRKRANTSKSGHSHEVLGYSPDDLLKHLQTFPTWDSLKQDAWHLDHVFPIIAFVRKGITDPKVICCLENLQPLAGPDNCVKNDNYDQSQFDLWLESHVNNQRIIKDQTAAILAGICV